jgi:hypothetical protein
LAKRINLANGYILRDEMVAKTLLDEAIFVAKDEMTADGYWNFRLFPKKILRAYVFMTRRMQQKRQIFGSDICVPGKRDPACNPGANKLRTTSYGNATA